MGKPMTVHIPYNQTMTTGPIAVKLGRREFGSLKEAAGIYPRQSYPIDPAVLKANGYGSEAIRCLVEGYSITYRDLQLTGPDIDIVEFPDGARYTTKLEFLGGSRIAITTSSRIPNAPR